MTRTITKVEVGFFLIISNDLITPVKNRDLKKKAQTVALEVFYSININVEWHYTKLLCATITPFRLKPPFDYFPRRVVQTFEMIINHIFDINPFK